MKDPEIDYQGIFDASPSAMLVLTPDLVIVDANVSYQDLVGRARHQLVDRYVYDAFPKDPEGPDDLKASLRRVLETRAQDVAGPMRHDVEEADRPGVFEERYWSPINAPVLDSEGNIVLVVHRLEEITDVVRACGPESDKRRLRTQFELYARSRELQQVNERLRQANARERQVALALQDAMLPAPERLDRHQAAVRYRPAEDTLNVCGDWYEVTQLACGAAAVAVGDVVGHGLAAAGIMGQLRSALSAAMRVVDGPATALDGLDMYARSLMRRPRQHRRADRHRRERPPHHLQQRGPPASRPWPTRTARCSSWTGRRIRPWGPALNTAPVRRPRPPTPTAPYSSSTATG